MSKIGPHGRSFKAISYGDLKRLVQIAQKDRQEFFKQNPRWKAFYANRVVCIALCQGAAKHYVDSETGINDFDLYTFYKRNPRKRWYAKRIKSYDFGDAKFGQSVDRPNFSGRRVDCLGREIDIHGNEEIVNALQRYLLDGKTKTARTLAHKAVVLLDPHCGTVIWPIKRKA
jgi:hypothetical protein